MNLSEILEKIEKTIERRLLEKEVYEAEVIVRKGDIVVILSSGAIQPGNSVAWVEDGIFPFGFVVDARKTRNGFVLAVKEFERMEGERIIEAENLLSLALRREALERMDEILNFEYWSGKKNVEAPAWLDKWQKECYSAACSLEEGEILLVIGPPGSGKTTFIAESAKFLSENERVWVTSNTNVAVDNVLEKLEKAIRIGHPSKITDDAKKHSLEARILSQIDFKNYEDFASRIANAYREIIRMQEEILKKGKITVGATILKGAMSVVRNFNFDTVIIDEASNTCLSTALIALEKAKKAVVVGDPYQLPPVYEINIPNSYKFSAFNHLYEKYRKALWLRKHYRCNSEIIYFSAKEIYGRLEIDERCRNIKIPKIETTIPKIGDPMRPLVFIDCEGEERKVGSSKINEVEAEIVVEICDELVSVLDENEVGIITPYVRQRELISQMLEDFGIGCEVSTVHSYQGREKEVIIYSITATKNFYFPSDKRLFNVALTRARSKFIAIGNAKNLEGKNLLLSRFLNYVKQRDGYLEWRKLFS
ncbi:MAG: AAA family ATPase [Archaeoglobales archaeon]|nr:AAA family ATPase [Archaeoglobales archaeon]